MTRHYLHIHEETLQANFRAFPDVFADGGGEIAPLPIITECVIISPKPVIATFKDKDAEALHGSIRINGQYRLCFEYADGKAYNVEIVDYH